MKSLYVLCFTCLIMINTGVDAQSVGTMAPDFTLDQLGGGQFKLSGQKGKVVFIFFFGYACPHCLANGPNTQTGIYDVYKNQPDFVAVGIDTWDGNDSGVSNFKSSTKIDYTLCLNGSSLEQLYQTTYDRIVVIDKEGIIRYKATANATSVVVAAASNIINDLLQNNDDDGMGDGDVITSTADPDTSTTYKVYPNPAIDRLSIEGPFTEIASVNIEIFDIAGRLKIEKEYKNIGVNSVNTNLESLKNGTYFIRISTLNATTIRKFMVSR